MTMDHNYDDDGDEITIRVSLERDLKQYPENVRKSPLATTALALADAIDGKSSPTAKANCARVLLDVLQDLRALLPPQVANDDVTTLATARANRRSRAQV